MAIRQAEGGQFQLVRTDKAIDLYHEPVPGQMAPWQYWDVPAAEQAWANDLETVGLVGAKLWFDLRSGEIAEPQEF
jgi:hypothetical protein